MTFGLGPRLFIALGLSLLMLGVTAIAAVRWSLAAAPAVPYLTREPNDRPVVQAVERAYMEHGNWTFLPSEEAPRRRWLRDQWLNALTAEEALTVVTSTDTYGDRIALTDASGQRLSGVVPGPMLRAIGSIDTRSRPLIVDHQTVGYVLISGAARADDTLAVAFLLQKGDRLGAVAGGALLIAFALAAALAIYVRRPIRTLVAGAQQLGAGCFDTRLDERRRDELGQLARSFNHLADRLKHAERARRQWIADVSHELRTPLAVVRAQLESFEDGVRSPSEAHFELMRTHIDSLTRRVEDLHLLARADVAQLRYDMQYFALWPLVQAVVVSFRERAATAGLTLSVGAPPPRSVVLGDADRIRQVLLNLLENAVRYTDAGGRIEVGGHSDGGSLQIIVEDSTPGVPTVALARLGERFFRPEVDRASKPGGAGLGLALACQIVHAHGGRITFAASAMAGLQVCIQLPLASE